MLIGWLARRLLVLGLILAVPLVAGELIARKLIGDALASTLASRFGGSPKVGFGSTPLLLQLVDGHLDDVTVSDAHAQIGELPPVGLSASFRDVHVTSLVDLHGATGAVTVRANLGAAAVGDLLATRSCIGSLSVALSGGLGAAPRILLRVGHVAVLPARGRRTEVRLVPFVVGGAISFRVAGGRLDGAALAPTTLADIAANADCVRTLSSLPFNLRLVRANATPVAVQLDFTAPRASFAVG